MKTRAHRVSSSRAQRSKCQEGSRSEPREGLCMLPVRMELIVMRRFTTLGDILRYLRRTRVGGAVEYAAQLVGGLIRPELLESGATPEDERRPLPRDDLVPHPMWEATRAITIDAPLAEVWPWVAQMGYGRGGWNPLEREDTGVTQLLPEIQPPTVGDIWLDGPGCDETKGAFTVKAAEEPRTLVLHSMRNPLTGRELDPSHKPYLYIDTGWTFHLDRIARHRTRIRVSPRWAILPLRWIGGGDTVMQRRLLEGIKVRAEAAASRQLLRIPHTGAGSAEAASPS
jgi:hypothetical protein